MAHITRFDIAGLVGRKEPYCQELRRDVNVFFGLNGTGKTSLLKILHGAMSDDTAVLRTVAFTSASVTVYSDEYAQEFVSVYTKPPRARVEPEGDAEENYLMTRSWALAADQVELFQTAARDGRLRQSEQTRRAVGDTGICPHHVFTPERMFQSYLRVTAAT